MPDVQLKFEVDDEPWVMKEYPLCFNTRFLATEARGDLDDEDYVEFALEVIEKIRQYSTPSEKPMDLIEDPSKIPREIIEEIKEHFAHISLISFAGYNIYPVPPEARSYRLKYKEEGQRGVRKNPMTGVKEEGYTEKRWSVRGYELNNVFFVWQVASGGFFFIPDPQ